VEVVNLRVRAEAPSPELALPKGPVGSSLDDSRRGERRVRLAGRTVVVPVFDRDALGDGAEIAGPALITGADSTCLLVEDQLAEVDALGMVVVR